MDPDVQKWVAESASKSTAFSVVRIQPRTLLHEYIFKNSKEDISSETIVH